MIEFDATGKGVDDFKLDVEDIHFTDGPATRLDFQYWIHAKGAAFNPEVILYLTPEQTVELYEKLGQYILDRNLTKTEEIA